MTEISDAIKTAALTIAGIIREGREAPPADIFDPDRFPYGKKPGANQMDVTTCPTCGKSPTSLVGTPHELDFPHGAFLFRDKLSAKEYYLSDMCQACQDEMFKAL